mmetsp:Transcript_32549/g.48267  ORF Transcript_32549/g.48267 Transcript_32549/m.48267 type:complete len:132 (-) Transcript_32549:253-648(-)
MPAKTLKRTRVSAVAVIEATPEVVPSKTRNVIRAAVFLIMVLCTVTATLLAASVALQLAPMELLSRSTRNSSNYVLVSADRTREFFEKANSDGSMLITLNGTKQYHVPAESIRVMRGGSMKLILPNQPVSG